MNTILFPTDFTENSLNAFTYAMEYAQGQDAKLIVYHAYQEGEEINEEIQKIYNKIDIDNFRNKKDKFPPYEKLIAGSKAGNLKVKYVVDRGEFVEAFRNYVARKEDKIDLVIMGTRAHGKSNLFKLFMETHTLRILEDIRKPVIAVPERATFDGSYDNIAFLVDYREDEIQSLGEIIEVSKELRAKLHVVHFDLAHGESIIPLMERFKEKVEQTEHREIIYKSIDTIDLKKSLNDYCSANKVDMVCLLNRKRNFYQRLFSFSLAEDLLAHLDLPIMAIYVD